MNDYSVGNWVDIFNTSNSILGIERYGEGDYNNVNTKLLARYPANSRGHHSDKVKLVNHPTHPSKGTFSKDGKIFDLSNTGLNDVNKIIFGATDNGDGQAVLTYKGSVVLPELTVTPNQRYVDDTYNNVKLFYKK